MMKLCFRLISGVSGDAGTTGTLVSRPPGLACRLLYLLTRYLRPRYWQNLSLSRVAMGSLLIIPFSGFSAAKGWPHASFWPRR